MEYSKGSVQRRLSEFCLKVVPIEPDGNCLFRAVAHQLYRDQSFHPAIRRECVDHILANGDFFRHFVAGEKLEERMRKMRRDGEWGDHLELQALAEVHAAQIEIYCRQEVPTVVYAADTPPKHIFRLFYNNLVHYDSIVEDSPSDQQHADLISLVAQQKTRLAKLNALISRKTFKSSSALTLKEIMERSLASLEKDFKTQTTAALADSEATQIEDDIVRQVMGETSGPKPEDNFTRLINMGFDEDAVIEALINIGDAEPSLDKYVNFIMMRQHF